MARLKQLLSSFVVFVIILTAFTPPGYINAVGSTKQYISTTVPKVYSSYIKKIKTAHPNWNFEFFYTNIDWNEMITKEGEPGRSLISYIYPKSYRSVSSDSYNYDTDSYTSYDAGGWYMAASETIAYCMDPRNFFSDEYIFQFEKLSYDENIHTMDGVKAILKGSFMDNVKIKNTNNKNVLYAQAFIDAAKYSGVSPYHLASRSIQEVGKNGSGSTSGTNSTYPGIYNFYNIGAYAGSSPITNGLRWASSKTAGTYMRPWDSQYKSIVGGAEYIGEGYINNKQNTLYLEKFDVVGDFNNTSLYTHQYMGNISAACSEGKSVYDTYKSLDVIENSFTFLIPVYNNMPSKACKSPIDAGSPRCWLKELYATGYEISPSQILQVSTNNFTINVPNGTKKIKISAVPVNPNATLTGLSKSSSSESTSGHVTDVSTSLRVRTSPKNEGDSNRLKDSGVFVNITNNTPITKLAEQLADEILWFKIAFRYNNKDLSGWVSSAYIAMDKTAVTYYENIGLNVGKNTKQIKVTSADGSTRTYNVTINREDTQTTEPTTEPVTVPTTEQPTVPAQTDNNIKISTYSVDEKNKYIFAIPDNTSVSAFIKNIKLPDSVASAVYSGEKQIKKGDLQTGMKLTLTAPGKTTAYLLAVDGDLNSDGIVNIFDLILVRNHILGSKTFKGICIYAADLNRDNTINIFDLIMVRNMILNA